MVRALIAGTIVGGLCAMIGVFVVQRGLSFIGDGLAHAAFGGIALGLMTGVAVERMTWVALPFTVLIACGITYILRRGSLRGDVATGVFSAVSFALGVLLLGAPPGHGAAGERRDGALREHPGHFGGRFAAGRVVGVLTLLLLAFTWGEARLRDVRPGPGRFIGRAGGGARLHAALAHGRGDRGGREDGGHRARELVVIIPAAAARMLGRTLASVAISAVAIGVIGAGVGLNLSYHANVASGATIILTLGAIFLGVLLVRRK
jgi:zinc transport system permease protein